MLMSSRILISQRGDRQRTGVGRHVNAIRQQRHRPEDHPRRDLDDHHDERDGDHDPRTARITIVVRAEELMGNLVGRGVDAGSHVKSPRDKGRQSA